METGIVVVGLLFVSCFPEVSGGGGETEVPPASVSWRGGEGEGEGPGEWERREAANVSRGEPAPDMLYHPGGPTLPPVAPALNDSDSLLWLSFRKRYPVEEWRKAGFFTEDYMRLINRHWLQFPPPSHRAHYILAAYYTLIMVVGVTGNALVIFMLLRCRSLRTPANILVMNLAISDLFMLLKGSVLIFNSLHFGPALGELGCTFYGFMGGLTGVASIFSLAAIALDRYYVIAYPLDPMRRTTRHRAALWAVFIWCYAAFFSVLPLTGRGFNRYVPEGYLTSCSFDYLTEDSFNRGFILVFFVAAWVVPFLVITVCYCGICRAVLGTGMARKGQEKEKRRTEVRLAVVVVAVIVLWFISWTPYAVVALLGISGKRHYITPLSSMIPAVFCKTASCTDPFVYALTHPRLRNELSKLFCFRRYEFERALTVKTVWKTEASRSSLMRRHNPPQDDVEEVVVMVDISRQGSMQDRISLESDSRYLSVCGKPEFNPPSWFASPKPKKNRSTSLKHRIEAGTPPDPISA